jgi:hypothetical protein
MSAIRHPTVVRLLIAAVALVLFSGCVYLRLLQLKRQLAQFDENFVLVDSDDFDLRFRRPVLTGDDLRWLGAEPKVIQETDTGAEWLIRWVKVPPAGANEPFEYDMEFHTRFAKDRLSEIVIPKRYFAYFSKDLFVNLLRSTGAAQVNKEKKQAEAQTETPPKATVPNLKDVKGMLGAPTQQSVVGSQTMYFYSYRLDLTKPAHPPIEVTFTFDSASGDLQKLIARLPRGTIKYNFSAASK